MFDYFCVFNLVIEFLGVFSLELRYFLANHHWVTFLPINQVDIPSEPEDDEEDPDGRFAFKRKLGVRYIAVG